MSGRKGYVEAGPGLVHYRRWPGESTLVLVHQSFSSSRMWERLAEALTPRVGVVAFDLPGHGESDPFPEHPTLADYAQVVIDGCRQLGLGQVAMGGFHAGAGVAVSAALSHPADVERLVLFGVPLFGAADRERIRASLPHGWRTDDDGSHLVEMWKVSSNPDLSIRTRELADKLLAGPEGWWLPSALFSVDLEEMLPGISTPALLLHSDRDFIADVQPRGEAALGDARRVEISGEVLIADDRPEEVARHIIEFLKGHG